MFGRLKFYFNILNIVVKMDRKFVNVIILGFGFMFVFTAFQTMGNIEVRLL